MMPSLAVVEVAGFEAAADSMGVALVLAASMGAACVVLTSGAGLFTPDDTLMCPVPSPAPR